MFWVWIEPGGAAAAAAAAADDEVAALLIISVYFCLCFVSISVTVTRVLMEVYREGEEQSCHGVVGLFQQ